MSADNEAPKKPNKHDSNAQAPASTAAQQPKAPVADERDKQPPKGRPAAIPAHDKDMARRFLAGLDPNACSDNGGSA
jgi:hypothetical protein